MSEEGQDELAQVLAVLTQAELPALREEYEAQLRARLQQELEAQCQS